VLRSTGSGSVNDVDLFAVLAVACEPDGTVRKCVECIIGSDPYVEAGMNVCAALTNKDITCENELSVRSLDTEALGLGVSAILCRSTPFLCAISRFPPFLKR
jgi:hypothetical protein